MAEEFGCLPSQAIREIRRAPDGFLEDIVEARAFAATLRVFRATKDKTELTPSPMLDLVVRTSFAVAQKQIDAKRRREHG